MPDWLPEERTVTARNGIVLRYTIVQEGRLNCLFDKMWSLRTRRDRRKARVKPCRICRVPIPLGEKAWRSLEDRTATYICTECMPAG